MSKKRKKRHPQTSPSSRTRSQGATLADEHTQAEKRLKPAARNLLFFNLVFLAIAQMLYSSHMISELISGACTIIGVILLLLALWLQFGNNGNRSHSGGQPRLK